MKLGYLFNTVQVYFFDLDKVAQYKALLWDNKYLEWLNNDI